MFQPLTDPPAHLRDADGPCTVVAVKANTVSLHQTERTRGASELFLGMLGDVQWWAVDADGDGDVDDDAFYVDLMRLYGQVDEVQWAAAGRAVQLIEWARTHRFCGRCATPTEPSPLAGERARKCPACGLLAFPRLAPAIITLVEHPDGRALLGRNARFPMPMFSCLAGFVEPGETLESAVAREVKEEVGVDVTDVTYVASQPWPFPHSLMLGFRALWANGEIECDGTEIAEAAWYAHDDLPMIPPPMSIARSLIDQWVARQRG